MYGITLILSYIIVTITEQETVYTSLTVCLFLVIKRAKSRGRVRQCIADPYTVFRLSNFGYFYLK